MKLARTNTIPLMIGAGAILVPSVLMGMQGSVTPQRIDCIRTIQDASNPGGCLEASTIPMSGKLYPLGPDLNINGSGQVGVGKTASIAALDVASHEVGADGIRVRGADGEAIPAGDGLYAVGGSGGNIGVGGGAGVRAFGGLGSNGVGSGGPGGPGVIAVGAFSPPDSGPGVYAVGGDSDGLAADGVIGVGGFGDEGAGGGRGVVGRGGDSFDPSFSFGGHGVVGTPGIGTTSNGLAIFAEGDYGGTGLKSFVQPHPLDRSREIRFVCLEGNESGTYFRGSGRTLNGVAVIEVPEEFRLVSDQAGLTVQLTSVGARADLWIESKDLTQVIVRSDKDVDFDYFVNGLRRGYTDFVPVSTNRSYVPKRRGEPFGLQYPTALRQILVENGTLNADFTPNELTAEEMGWELEGPEDLADWERPLRRND